MRAAVTGAGGFIGRALVARLLKCGWEVSALDLPQGLARVPAGARRVPCDIRDRETLRSGLRRATVVFHTAALFDLAAAWPDLYAANVDGVGNVCAVAQELRVDRVLCWGSSSVYGMTRRPVPLTETVRVTTDRLSSYARSKHLGELEALAAAESGGPEVLIIRPADVYGPGSYKGLAQALYSYKLGLMNAVPGPGTAVHSHVHVDDVARAAIHLAQAGEPGGIYNMADRTPISVADLYAIVRGRIGGFSIKERRITFPDRPRLWGRPVFRVPVPVLRLFGRWEVLRARRGWLVGTLGPHPLATPAGVDFLLGHHVIDASKLLGTGFALTWPDVKAGVLATLDEYERSGWVAFRPGAEGERVAGLEEMPEGVPSRS